MQKQARKTDKDLLQWWESFWKVGKKALWPASLLPWSGQPTSNLWLLSSCLCPGLGSQRKSISSEKTTEDPPAGSSLIIGSTVPLCKSLLFTLEPKVRGLFSFRVSGPGPASGSDRASVSIVE